MCWKSVVSSSKAHDSEFAHIFHSLFSFVRSLPLLPSTMHTSFVHRSNFIVCCSKIDPNIFQLPIHLPYIYSLMRWKQKKKSYIFFLMKKKEEHAANMAASTPKKHVSFEFDTQLYQESTHAFIYSQIQCKTFTTTDDRIGTAAQHYSVHAYQIFSSRKLVLSTLHARTFRFAFDAEMRVYAENLRGTKSLFCRKNLRRQHWPKMEENEEKTTSIKKYLSTAGSFSWQILFYS